MLVGCMVDDEFCDDAQVAPFRLGHEAAEITHRAEIWVDVSVVRYVVTVVAAGTGIEGQKPERGNAEVLQIIKTFPQAGKVADPIIIAVAKRLDMQLIDNGVLEPQWVRRH